MVVKYLDGLVKVNKKIEKVQGWADLLTELDDLSKRVMKLEACSNNKSMYLSPLKYKRMKLLKGGHSGEALSHST